MWGLIGRSPGMAQRPDPHAGEGLRQMRIDLGRDFTNVVLAPDGFMNCEAWASTSRGISSIMFKDPDGGHDSE